MYPTDMKEISLDNYDDVKDLIYQIWEKTCYRQIFENHKFPEFEELQIIWINESKNLGYAFGCENKKIKLYKIGSDKAWSEFNNEQASKIY